MDDAELEATMRREVAQRVERILGAIQGTPGDENWAEVHRQAHTLAGIASDLDDDMSKKARRLTELTTDARGRVQPPTGRREAEARRLAHGLSDRFRAL